MTQSEIYKSAVSAIEALKKNTVSEIASCVQPLVNLVNDGELSYFTIHTSIEQNFGINPFTYFTIRVNPYENDTKKYEKMGFMLGVMEREDFEDLNDSNFSKDMIDSLLKVNEHVKMLNLVCKDSIPMSESKRYTYLFSKERLKAEGEPKSNKSILHAVDFTSFKMIPEYLNDLVDLNGSSIKKGVKPKKNKP